MSTKKLEDANYIRKRGNQSVSPTVVVKRCGSCTKSFLDGNTMIRRCLFLNKEVGDEDVCDHFVMQSQTKRNW